MADTNPTIKPRTTLTEADTHKTITTKAQPSNPLPPLNEVIPSLQGKLPQAPVPTGLQGDARIFAENRAASQNMITRMTRDERERNGEYQQLEEVKQNHLEQTPTREALAADNLYTPGYPSRTIQIAPQKEKELEILAYHEEFNKSGKKFLDVNDPAFQNDYREFLKDTWGFNDEEIKNFVSSKEYIKNNCISEREKALLFADMLENGIDQWFEEHRTDYGGKKGSIQADDRLWGKNEFWSTQIKALRRKVDREYYNRNPGKHREHQYNGFVYKSSVSLQGGISSQIGDQFEAQRQAQIRENFLGVQPGASKSPAGAVLSGDALRSNLSTEIGRNTGGEQDKRLRTWAPNSAPIPMQPVDSVSIDMTKKNGEVVFSPALEGVETIIKIGNVLTELNGMNFGEDGLRVFLKTAGRSVPLLSRTEANPVTLENIEKALQRYNDGLTRAVDKERVAVDLKDALKSLEAIVEEMKIKNKDEGTMVKPLPYGAVNLSSSGVTRSVSWSNPQPSGNSSHSYNMVDDTIPKPTGYSEDMSYKDKVKDLRKLSAFCAVKSVSAGQGSGDPINVTTMQFHLEKFEKLTPEQKDWLQANAISYEKSEKFVTVRMPVDEENQRKYDKLTELEKDVAKQNKTAGQLAVERAGNTKGPIEMKGKPTSQVTTPQWKIPDFTPEK